MGIRREDVRALMVGRFGRQLEIRDCLTEPLLHLLQTWSPRQTSLDTLCERLQDTLYAGLRDVLGESLLLMDGIRWRRITTADLGAAADDLLGLVFTDLRESWDHYGLVRDWAWRTGSLAALQCLSERFSAWQTPEDQLRLASICRERKDAEKRF